MYSKVTTTITGNGQWLWLPEREEVDCPCCQDGVQTLNSGEKIICRQCRGTKKVYIPISVDVDNAVSTQPLPYTLDVDGVYAGI